MTWGEAIRLARALSADPSSMVCAAVNDWESPRSREWLLLADLFDLTHSANSSRRPKPYPRPGNRPRRWGNRGDRTPAQVLAALRPVE